MQFKLIRENKLVFLCFLIATILLLKNLGNMYLWTDEANSAVPAKNILQFGYPSNFDGRNIVQHYWNYDGELKLSPFYRTTTWLHLYVAALSFKLLGINTFAARFPFALIGLGVIISLFLLLRKYKADKFIINTSVLLLTLNVFFLIHMRQCRYYSMATLFTLLAAWAYLDFYQNGKKTKFIIYSVLLFLSMHSAYPILMLAVAIHALLFFKRGIIKGLLIAWGWMSLVVVPVIIFLRLWERPIDLMGLGHYFKGMAHLRLLSYLVYLNDYMIPFVLVAIYLIWKAKRRELTIERLKNNQLLTFSAILLAVAVVFLAIVAPHNFRFIVPYIPFSIIILSYILCFLKKRTNLYVVILLILVLVTTNFIHQAPYYLSYITRRPVVKKVLTDVDEKLKGKEIAGFPMLRLSWLNYKMGVFLNPTSWLYRYLYEITHDYDGPNEGISKYINQHAGPDDIVKATYGDFIYQFYTNRIVIPRGQFENEIMPDWWVFRGAWWHHGLLNKYKAVLDRDYEKIVLNYPELRWGNLPNPDYHKFKTVEDAPRVVIYRRKKSKTPQEIARNKELIKQMWPWK